MTTHSSSLLALHHPKFKVWISPVCFFLHLFLRLMILNLNGYSAKFYQVSLIDSLFLKLTVTPYTHCSKQIFSTRDMFSHSTLQRNLKLIYPTGNSSTSTSQPLTVPYICTRSFPCLL